MNPIFTYSLIGAVCFLTGCRSLTSPARAHQLPNGVTWVDYDATRRGALITSKDAGAKMLSEPAPDVAVGLVADFVAKSTLTNIPAEFTAKMTESITELGKRTQTVMVLRECLFRLNELQMAKPDITSTSVVSLYTQILTTITELAKSDTASANAELLAQINALIKSVGTNSAANALNSLNIQKPPSPDGTEGNQKPNRNSNSASSGPKAQTGSKEDKPIEKNNPVPKKEGQ